MGQRKHYQDPELHEQHIAFLRARCQAKFRKEGWDLTIEQFFELWKGSWNKRGRSKESLVMARKDLTESWSWNNVEIITRYDQLLRQFELNNFFVHSPQYKKRTYKRRQK